MIDDVIAIRYEVLYAGSQCLFYADHSESGGAAVPCGADGNAKSEIIHVNTLQLISDKGK